MVGAPSTSGFGSGSAAARHARNPAIAERRPRTPNPYPGRTDNTEAGEGRASSYYGNAARVPPLRRYGIVADAAVRQRRNEESLGTYLGFGMRRPAQETTLVMEAHEFGPRVRKEHPKW